MPSTANAMLVITHPSFSKTTHPAVVAVGVTAASPNCLNGQNPAQFASTSPKLPITLKFKFLDGEKKPEHLLGIHK